MPGGASASMGISMLDHPRTGRGRTTCWKSIRLELARTPEFPEGSASRIYLLRLPLDQESLIEERALKQAPALATVHRYWPNEPDMFGYVIRTPQGWAISYEPGEQDDETVFHLETHPMRQGNYITLTEPDGRRLPFRVASVRPMT
jgi:hypothetical protein